jgi:hypothetical protein
MSDSNWSPAQIAASIASYDQEALKAAIAAFIAALIREAAK